MPAAESGDICQVGRRETGTRRSCTSTSSARSCALGAAAFFRTKYRQSRSRPSPGHKCSTLASRIARPPLCGWRQLRRKAGIPAASTRRLQAAGEDQGSRPGRMCGCCCRRCATWRQSPVPRRRERCPATAAAPHPTRQQGRTPAANTKRCRNSVIRSSARMDMGNRKQAACHPEDVALKFCLVAPLFVVPLRQTSPVNVATRRQCLAVGCDATHVCIESQTQPGPPRCASTLWHVNCSCHSPGQVFDGAVHDSRIWISISVYTPMR